MQGARAVERGKGFQHFHHSAYVIASAYAVMREPELALSYLQLAANDGFPCCPVFDSDPNLNNLRTNPVHSVHVRTSQAMGALPEYFVIRWRRQQRDFNRGAPGSAEMVEAQRPKTIAVSCAIRKSVRTVARL